jgi:ADP-heptose:LPS heptosyltransferase
MVRSSGARERIAFVELWRLGDSVLATGGLRTLRLARPDAEIALVSNPAYSDPLLRSGDYDVHIPLAAFWTRGLVARDKYLPWTIDYGAIVRAWRRLRDFRADTYLLFRGDPREQLLFASVGHGSVVDGRRRHPILPGTQLLPAPVGGHRYLEYVRHVQQWAGTEIAVTPHLANVRVAVEPRPYVLLHPGAGWVFRHWKADKMATLADALTWILQPVGSALIVIGGPTERPLLEAIGRAATAPLDVRYPSLDELYGLVAGARAVVCNNTATLHIAEALDVPCAVMTGPSDPVRWGIFRSHSRTVCRSVGLPCHPCLERQCVRADRPCIDEIGTADVIAALTDIGILPAETAIIGLGRAAS